MPRSKTSTIRHRRHQKVLERTKGFRGANNRLYKHAKEADLHAGQYAYVGRKLRKRDFRSLWILRINAAVRMIDETLKYSTFIRQLKQAQISLDRRSLAEIAARDFGTFKKIVSVARAAK
jgi:large subunit ribosomal protein L20